MFTYSVPALSYPLCRKISLLPLLLVLSACGPEEERAGLGNVETAAGGLTEGSQRLKVDNTVPESEDVWVKLTLLDGPWVGEHIFKPEEGPMSAIVLEGTENSTLLKAESLMSEDSALRLKSLTRRFEGDSSVAEHESVKEEGSCGQLVLQTAAQVGTDEEIRIELPECQPVAIRFNSEWQDGEGASRRGVLGSFADLANFETPEGESVNSQVEVEFYGRQIRGE